MRFAHLLHFAVIALLIVAAIAGCSVSPLPQPGQDTFPWKHRAMAEIAIVSVTAGTPDAKPHPKVGDKCPDCGDNDPRTGGCPVGQTGDGRDCNICQKCGGDGRMDERDLTAGELPVSEGPAAGDASKPERSITIYLASETDKWGPQWYADNRQAFTDDGWKVRLVIDTDARFETPFFEVVDGDWTTEFFEPLTIELLQEWVK